MTWQPWYQLSTCWLTVLVPLTPDDLQGHKDVACSQDFLRDTEMTSGETLLVTHFFSGFV